MVVFNNDHPELEYRIVDIPCVRRRDRNANKDWFSSCSRCPADNTTNSEMNDCQDVRVSALQRSLCMRITRNTRITYGACISMNRFACEIWFTISHLHRTRINSWKLVRFVACTVSRQVNKTLWKMRVACTYFPWRHPCRNISSKYSQWNMACVSLCPTSHYTTYFSYFAFVRWKCSSSYCRSIRKSGFISPSLSHFRFVIFSFNSKATKKFPFTVSNIISWSIFHLDAIRCIFHIFRCRSPFTSNTNHSAIAHISVTCTRLCTFRSLFIFSPKICIFHTLIFTLSCSDSKEASQTAQCRCQKKKLENRVYKVEAILCLHGANGEIGEAQKSISGEENEYKMPFSMENCAAIKCWFSFFFALLFIIIIIVTSIKLHFIIFRILVFAHFIAFLRYTARSEKCNRLCARQYCASCK